jgi:hypothetical protein
MWVTSINSRVLCDLTNGTNTAPNPAEKVKLAKSQLTENTRKTLKYWTQYTGSHATSTRRVLPTVNISTDQTAGFTAFLQQFMCLLCTLIESDGHVDGETLLTHGYQYSTFYLLKDADGNTVKVKYRCRVQFPNKIIKADEQAALMLDYFEPDDSVNTFVYVHVEAVLARFVILVNI